MPAVQDVDFTPVFELNSRSAILPSDKEVSENSRSRSAKLRVAIRTDERELPPIESLLPRAPAVSDYRWAA